VLEEPAALTLFVPSIPPRLADLLHLIATRPRAAIALFRFMLGAIIPAQKAFKRGEEDKGLWILVRGLMGRRGFEQIPEEVREQLYENRNEARALMLDPEPESPPLGDEAVRGIRAPVLLVTGEHSPSLHRRMTDRLEELLLAERVEISDASHLMHQENASAVNEAIVGFLGRHREMSSPSP
jgi:pimeloyl-ACP methyl ester carboxylesterase